MTELPPALRPWEEELQVFPPQVAAPLLEPIRRLAQAIGPLHAPPVRGDGEPDGFDGVDRRGPYERLLLSEWLLASELPMEFLRRAADREQAFLKLRRVEPGTSRRTVVLLDAGPSQVGEPRLAHLVALVVLARRARVAGAEFRWGLLQHGGLYRDLGYEAVAAFRRGGSHRRPTDGHLARWRQRLAEEAPQDDDLWVVGDVEDLGPGDPATRVTVSEVIEPGPARLNLAIRRGHATRVLGLDLPQPEQVVSAFRCALVRPGRAPVSLEHLGDGRMWFSPDGNRLIVLGSEGARALHVPNSTAALKSPAGRGATRSWDADGLLAVGFRGRRFCGLTLSGDELTTFKGRTGPLPQGFAMPTEPVRAYENNLGTWVVDQERVLWRFPEGVRVAEDVSDFDANGYIHASAGVTWRTSWGGTRSRVLEHEAAALCGVGLAWPEGDGSWRVLSSGEPKVVSVPPGATVHGLVPGRGEGLPVCLLCLDESRLRVLKVGTATKVLHVSDRPVSALCASPSRPQLALRTEAGKLVVLHEEHTFFEIGPGAQP